MTTLTTTNNVTNIRIYDYEEVPLNQRHEAFDRINTNGRVKEFKLETLFAVVDNKIVGFASLDSAFLYYKSRDFFDIEVDPLYRRKGIGSTLMLAAMQKVKAEGGKYFRVELANLIGPSDPNYYEEIKDFEPWRKKSYEKKQQSNEIAQCFFENISVKHGIDFKRSTIKTQRALEFKFNLETLCEGVIGPKNTTIFDFDF